MHPVGVLDHNGQDLKLPSAAASAKASKLINSVRFDLGADEPSSPEASTSSASPFDFSSGSSEEDEEDEQFWCNPAADGVLRDDASWAGTLPAAQGLYDPEHEKGEDREKGSRHRT